MVVVSDGFHSLADGTSNIIGLVGITLSGRPADKDHPYGREKYETLASIIIAVLLLLTIATYALDFLSGYFGAKYFGATKWGMWGAIVGALVGIFFGIIGLFIGPVIGAILGEFIAGKRMIDAGRAGWGSLIGNLGGTIAKLVIGLVMITIFFLTVPPPF